MPERQCAWRLVQHRKKLVVPSLSFFIIISACGGGNKQGLQLQEVPASAPDPIIDNLDRNDINPPGARIPRTLHYGHFDHTDALVVYRASMFNPESRTSANPILVKFDAKGEVDSIRRLLVIVGTSDDVEKKSASTDADHQTLEKIFENVKSKKLDMRKAEDRLSLIQEATHPYGADKAALFGVRIYDASWKLRYRWPAENSKQ